MRGEQGLDQGRQRLTAREERICAHVILRHRARTSSRTDLVRASVFSTAASSVPMLQALSERAPLMKNAARPRRSQGPRSRRPRRPGPLLVAQVAELVGVQLQLPRRSGSGRARLARPGARTARRISQNLPWFAATSVASAASGASGCTSGSGRCRHTYRTWPESLEKLPHRGFCLGRAVRALELAFDDGDPRSSACDVVPAPGRRAPRGRRGPRTCRAAPQPEPWRQQGQRPEHEPGEAGRGQRDRQDAELRLLKFNAAERERRD